MINESVRTSGKVHLSDLFVYREAFRPLALSLSPPEGFGNWTEKLFFFFNCQTFACNPTNPGETWGTEKTSRGRGGGSPYGQSCSSLIRLHISDSGERCKIALVFPTASHFPPSPGDNVFLKTGEDSGEFLMWRCAIPPPSPRLLSFTLL